MPRMSRGQLGQCEQCGRLEYQQHLQKRGKRRLCQGGADAEDAGRKGVDYNDRRRPKRDSGDE